ncbi:hypothetical protein HUJ04_012115 [Dendroctonus ponderosae]|nr:hypothetical protein HUJ04_012115 [Dendroctonus ponderosae]
MGNDWSSCSFHSTMVDYSMYHENTSSYFHLINASNISDSEELAVTSDGRMQPTKVILKAI